MRPLALVIVLAFTGCVGRKEFIIVNEKAVRPASSANAPIEILLEPPERPYTVIAKVRVSGDERNLRDDVEEQLRTRARAIGADAVIIKTSASTSDRKPTHLSYRVTCDGTIIRWKTLLRGNLNLRTEGTNPHAL